MNKAISQGMSRAYKQRSRPCPKCGRKTVQARGVHYWKRQPFVCRFGCKPESPAPKASE